MRNFDFELWRQRYLNWVKTKKARITDFFRKQAKNEVSSGRGLFTRSMITITRRSLSFQDGTINRDEFVAGMLDSKFPTNKAELNAVFNIFDRDNSGSINYREFIEALRPVSRRYVSLPLPMPVLL